MNTEPLEERLDGWGRNGWTVEAVTSVDDMEVLVHIRDPQTTLQLSFTFLNVADKEYCNRAERTVLEALYRVAV